MHRGGVARVDQVVGQAVRRRELESLDVRTVAPATRRRGRT